MLHTGFEDACYEHISLLKSGEDNQWIQLKIMLIKAPVPAPYTIFQHSFRLTFRKRVSQAYCFYFKRLRGTHTPCLSTWLHLHFFYRMKIPPIAVNNRNTSFVIKSNPFPELTDILLREQCETSSGYWYEHKLEGAVCTYSPNLGFRKSIPRAINAPRPQKTKSSNSSNESKCCVKVYAYKTFIYDGSYGNAAFKLKKSFSVEIPIWH